MKKMVLVAVALMTLASGFAKTEKENAVQRLEQKYDMTFDMRRLAVTLDLTYDQMEAIQTIQDNFNDEMKSAAGAHGFMRHIMVDKAIEKDVRNMRQVLNEKQYNTYMQLLGLTLRNKGIR
jgi:hypothetical protein